MEDDRIDEGGPVTIRELDAAYDAGSEDGEFSPERWRDGKPRDTYLEAWNLANPDDQRTLDPSDNTYDDSCETPLTREEFVAMMRAELIAFERLPHTSQTRTFECWFEEFEADVFAPAGP